MNNNYLREQVKLLKAFQNITYKELAEYLEITQNGFYCWLRGNYELGDRKQKKLKDIIDILKE